MNFYFFLQKDSFIDQDTVWLQTGKLPFIPISASIIARTQSGAL
jgi:hypothetical protein